MSTFGKVILTLNGVGALAYGGYYYTQSKAVSTFDKEVKDITRIIDADTARISSSHRTALAEQEKMEALLKQSAVSSKSLEGLSKQMKVLEEQRDSLKAQHQHMVDSISSAADKIQEMTGEGARAKESLKMGERNLLQARKNVDSARLLLNPMNHPRFKALISGSKS